MTKTLRTKKIERHRVLVVVLFLLFFFSPNLSRKKSFIGCHLSHGRFTLYRRIIFSWLTPIDTRHLEFFFSFYFLPSFFFFSFQMSSSSQRYIETKKIYSHVKETFVSFLEFSFHRLCCMTFARLCNTLSFHAGKRWWH